MNNLECTLAILAAHREGRAWTDEAVAPDLLNQLGLDPAGEAKNARPIVDPDETMVAEAEAEAKDATEKADKADAVAKEATDRARTARSRLDAKTRDQKPDAQREQLVNPPREQFVNPTRQQSFTPPPSPPSPLTQPSFGQPVNE